MKNGDVGWSEEEELSKRFLLIFEFCSTPQREPSAPSRTAGGYGTGAAITIRAKTPELLSFLRFGPDLTVHLPELDSFFLYVYIKCRKLESTLWKASSNTSVNAKDTLA